MQRKKAKPLEPYVKNEISANRHMSFALLVTAIMLFGVWLAYYFKAFQVVYDTWLVTVITIPVVIVVLTVPMLFIKSQFISKPFYKYFLLGQFILAITLLNIVMPKHAVLGWALCIALTAHYYNPKATRIVYVVVVIMMFICIGAGTFLGEFDSNLLSGDLNEENQTIVNFLLPDVYPDTPAGRFEYLRALMAVGENRFLKIATQYYVGRLLFISLLDIVIVLLNKRTKVLLADEIEASNENQRNKTELEVAKDIQINTLPNAIADFGNTEFIGELKAAKEVGGDLFDMIEIDENRVAVLIGDVSGKGVPAAMFMMKTITSFRDFAKGARTPSEILKEVNASVYMGNKSTMFVTCFLAILDRRTGLVTYANAGHNPPLIGSRGNYRYLKCQSGLLLGCFEEALIIDEEITLKPGEGLIFYTDGVTEARNSEGKLLGEKRFLNLVNESDAFCGVALHRSIKKGIADFVQAAPQSDDITIVSLYYHGDCRFYQEKRFSAKAEKIPSMLSFVDEFVQKHGCEEAFKNELSDAGNALLSDLIQYGHEKGGSILIHLLFNEGTNEFTMTIIDSGKELTEEFINAEGETGLAKAKKVLGEIAYDRIDESNVLVLRKHFK